MSNKIAVITSTRAEYGLLRPVIKEIINSENLDLSLIVTGTHLSEKFGNTITEIEKDNFPIYKCIDILKFSSNKLGTAQTISYTIGEFSEFFASEDFSAVLLLGDRFEIFAIATASAVIGVPIIHISGGDVTKGASDDYFRHCITKMSALHFPSCEEYANRVISMGEEPRRVYNVGGLGDENIRKLPLMSREDLSKSINFDLSKDFALVTYHPETLSGVSAENQVKELLNVLDKYSDYNFIFTKANADAGGEKINEILDDYVAKHKNSIAFTSMGVVRYLSAMKYARAVIGNSSSGVVETPSFGVPTLNIGNRQAGRIICDNVICTSCDEKDIENGLETIFSSEFLKLSKNTISPYNGGNTSKKIVNIIEEFISSDLYNEVKEFYDVK